MKQVADTTRQLSVRIDERDFDRLDHVCAHLGGETRVDLQRSHVVRRLIHDGIAAYWKTAGLEEPLGPVQAAEAPAAPTKKRKRASKKG